VVSRSAVRCRQRSASTNTRRWFRDSASTRDRHRADCRRLLLYFGNLRTHAPSRYCIGDMLFAPVKSRRKSLRRWVTMPVVICNRRSRIDGHSINLSAGGIYVFAAANLSVGTQIEIEFRPPGSNELLRVRGTIRRRALYLYRIEFLSDAAASGDSRACKPKIQFLQDPSF